MPHKENSVGSRGEPMGNDGGGKLEQTWTRDWFDREDDSFQEPPSHHMGAIYGFLAPSPELPRKPGEWQSFDITLIVGLD